MNCLPILDRAGRFPLVNATFDFCYRGQTHVLHLYEYDATLNLDGERFDVHAGDVTCIAAGSIYSLAANDPGSHWCIHFHDAPSDEEDSFTLPVHLPLRKNSMLIAEQFRMISRLHHDPASNVERRKLLRCEARARLKSLLLQLCNLQHSGNATRRGRDPIDWDALETRIDEYMAELVTTESLAAGLDVPPPLLTRRFREHHGCTIKQHLLRKRIVRAQSLLATTILTIGEVGAAVGIPDPQYFNKQFRRITGQSPSQCRESNRKLLASRSLELATMDGQWRDRG